MNLSEKNLFARYYNWIWRDLPNDVCTFFWGTLLMLLMFPLFVPGRLFGNKYDNPIEDVAKSLAIYFVLFLSIIFGTVPYLALGENHSIYIWLVSLNDWIELGILSITGLVEFALIAAIVIGIGYINNKRKKNKKNVYSDEPTTFDKAMDFIGAVRGKYCTKINWK